jgi:hypothetical protein
MTNEEFEVVVEEAIQRTKDTLNAKGIEYSGTTDRLEQFKIAGELQDINPAQALFGMMAKHIISVAKMVNNPMQYTKAEWLEKNGDLRNYTILLEAVLVDIGVE